ncbi:receptor-like protein EIX2 [Castanea sativa]|uniref:receptor-like protein EIX2 n=1 Tax=Castanea sativa TaxID=21020 RepID=UPI003F65403C
MDFSYEIKYSLSNLIAIFLFLSLLGSSFYEIIKLGSCSEDENYVKCIHTEKEAPLSFKKGLSDYSPGRLSSWISEDCYQWRGIECNNKSGLVTKLDLQNTFMNSWLGAGGEIKISSSLINLKYLNYLDMGDYLNP